MPTQDMQIDIATVLKYTVEALFTISTSQICVCCEGNMNFEEFLQFLLDKRHLTDPEADIRNAFQLFDKDADGYLTAKDLKQVFSVTFCTFQVIHLSVSNLTTRSIRYSQYIQELIRR